MTNFFRLQGSHSKDKKNSKTPEMATIGLHEFIFNTLKKHTSSSFSLLDLGAGSGAWGLRIESDGNKVKGIHLEPDGCQIDCIEADLNEQFSKHLEEKFEVISCIEVLEHVEHPRNVFREAAKLLKKNGVFIISTPNASGIYSRLKFFITGRFAMFDDFQYDDIGHITPLTHWQLKKMYEEAGFKIVETASFDSTPYIPKSVGDLIKRISWVFRPIMSGFVGAQNIVMVGKKE